MSAMKTPHQPYNWSITSIPLAFGLALAPHFYFQARLMAATKGQQSNTMPRLNLETWKGRMPMDLWNHLAKARGAHLNSMEVFPLFAAAMVAGNIADVPAKDMNSLVLSFFTSRLVYMGLYIAVKNETVALARTAVYVWSISIPILGLWKAGDAMRTL